MFVRMNSKKLDSLGKEEVTEFNRNFVSLFMCATDNNWFNIPVLLICRQKFTVLFMLKKVVVQH